VDAPSDRGHISLVEPADVAYWTRTLAVSESRLKQLVARHGTLIQKIREALGK
jgi:hypothetical protein